MGGGGGSSMSITKQYMEFTPVTNINFEELAEAFINASNDTNEVNKEIAQADILLRAKEFQTNNENKINELLQSSKMQKTFLLLGGTGLGIYAYKKKTKKKGKK